MNTTIRGMTIQKLAYTFEEAAEQCGYSVATLKRAVADGNLAARYANTEGAIRHEDLAAWVGQLPTKPSTGTRTAQQEPGPTTPQGQAPQLPIPKHENEWFTPEELGKHLRVSPGTLGNWRTSKTGPAFVRVGGMVRYRRDAVGAWIDSQPSK